jgi:hypothetical protein
MDSNLHTPMIAFQYFHPRINEEWWLANSCFLIFKYNNFTFGILDDCLYFSRVTMILVRLSATWILLLVIYLMINSKVGHRFLYT